MTRAILFAALLLLSACGQKGPLYLPEPAGNVVVRPSQTPPPPAAEDAGKTKEKKPGEPP
ncbi:MAG: lipoprotein [Steroidobacteraceae bacterium]